MLIHWKTLHIYKFVLIEKCSVINWSLNFRKLAWLQWLSFRTRIRRKFLLKNYFLKINWHSFTFKWVHKLDFQRIFSIFRHLDFLNYAQLNNKFENQCQSNFFFFKCTTYFGAEIYNKLPLSSKLLYWTTLCGIEVQGKINVQVGKFLKNIKRADQNKSGQGGFFSQN